MAVGAVVQWCRVVRRVLREEMLPKAGSDDPERHPDRAGLTEEHLFPDRHFIHFTPDDRRRGDGFGFVRNRVNPRPAQFRVGTETGVGRVRATATLLL